MQVHFPNYNEHEINIRVMLGKLKIPDYGILFTYRVNSGVAIADHHLTLVILSRYEEGGQASWVAAVKEIRSSLLQAGIQCAIEMIDHMVFHLKRSTAPITSTERNLIEGWDKVKPSFLAMIEERHWLAIDVLHRGLPAREKRPTIIISARDANSDTWWRATLPALQELLRTFGLDVDIEILFLLRIRRLMNEPIKSTFTEPNYISPDHTLPEDHKEPEPEPTDFQDRVPHPQVQQYFYADELRGGTSCSTPGSKGSGTLGGSVMLQQKDETLELGITNYHVIRDVFADQGSLTGPYPPNQSYGMVVSPSDRDHLATIEILQKNYNDNHTDYDEVSQNLQLLTDSDQNWAEENPHKWRLKKQRQNFLFHTYKSLGEKLDFAKTNPPREIGSVYAASGFRLCDNSRYPVQSQQPQQSEQPDQRKDWALDWGLVQLDKGKTISMQLKDLPSELDVHYGHVVDQYVSISPNRNFKVFKNGRTSGWAPGQLSAIKSTIRLQDPVKGSGENPTNPGERQESPEMGLPTIQQATFTNKLGGKPVWAHAIVGEWNRPQFLEPGDSGCLIELNEPSYGPSIVGLGFAANDANLASYMEPFDLVVKDIEDVTGGKVVEPRYAGNVE
ncbi:hypothetical protein N0V90_013190 [Kalmusia sp. IMI 367209]|nr:hypothetical protein N0V90_013190 [Kalmusia sp. IMI 367209]